MLKLIREWLATKEAEQSLERTRLDVEGKQLRKLEEATNQITERPDTGGWQRGGFPWQDFHNPAERRSMVQQARTMFRFDPNARGVLSTLVYYIIGEGVKITPQSKDPRIHRLWREFWNSTRNRMPLRQAEIILRTLRDGEVFLQFYRTTAGEKNWKTTVRFRDPELCRTPAIEYGGTSGQASDGIKMRADDPETPETYFFQKMYNDPTQVDAVPAEDVLHIKIGSDSEQKRGESYIQPAMEMFGQYKEWLRYRIVLNKVRTALVLIKKINGGSTDVAAIQATIGASPTQKSGESKKRIPPPGTMITTNQGVDYDFKSANINASDAAEDGRSMKLSMAAGCNVPEYVFGDASNANYASTLIAESPFVKGIRFWQTFFEFHLKELFKQVVRSAVEAGKLTSPPEDDIFKVAEGEEQETPVQEAEVVPPKPVAKAGEEEGDETSEQPEDPTQEFSEFEAFWGCDVQWPEVVHREMDKTANAVINMVNAKLISEPTACSVLGYDYEEEVRKQQQVEDGAEHNPFKQGGMAFGDDADMDAEAQDIMKDLTPEESDKLMKSGDPKAMLKLVAEKKAAKKKKEVVPSA